MITVYHFPYFKLEYDQQTGRVTTLFSDKSICSVIPNSEDERHGRNLGLSGGQHKLLHELIHSLIATARGKQYCEIVYAQANSLPMPLNAPYIERMVFALSYEAHQTPMLFKDWHDAIEEVKQFTNLPAILRDIKDLQLKINTDKVTITYK